MTPDTITPDSAMPPVAVDPKSASVEGTHPNPVTVRVLKQLEDAGITYCVLRGGDQLDEDETDVLVPPREMRNLRRVLAESGFVHLRAWGHAPHHFFVTYDANEDRWLKLDVVTQIAYGRTTHPLTTNLAKNCLRNRRQLGSVYVPTAEDELVMLLLHCVVDKGRFSERWRRRLVELCEQIRDEEYVSDALAKYWSIPMTARTVKKIVEGDNWDWLLEDRTAVTGHLAARHPIGTAVRSARDHVLRKLNRLSKLVWPQSLSVALLAPDGAGKSTLAEGVCEHFFFPVEQIYMGLYQPGNKAGSSRVPGLGLARKLCVQWRRYFRGHLYRARGRLVIFDRYTCDALLPAPYKMSRLQRSRRWLLAHACPSPDLILLLDAPAEVLFARKGEHDVEYLNQHRQAYVNMLKKFPQMMILDATRGPEEVRRKAISHIWCSFTKRFGKYQKQPTTQ